MVSPHRLFLRHMNSSSFGVTGSPHELGGLVDAIRWADQQSTFLASQPATHHRRRRRLRGRRGRRKRGPSPPSEQDSPELTLALSSASRPSRSSSSSSSPSPPPPPKMATPSRGTTEAGGERRSLFSWLVFLSHSTGLRRPVPLSAMADRQVLEACPGFALDVPWFRFEFQRRIRDSRFGMPAHVVVSRLLPQTSSIHRSTLLLIAFWLTHRSLTSQRHATQRNVIRRLQTRRRNKSALKSIAARVPREYSYSSPNSRWQGATHGVVALPWGSVEAMRQAGFFDNKVGSVFCVLFVWPLRNCRLGSLRSAVALYCLFLFGHLLFLVVVPVRLNP